MARSGVGELGEGRRAVGDEREWGRGEVTTERGAVSAAWNRVGRAAALFAAALRTRRSRTPSRIDRYHLARHDHRTEPSRRLVLESLHRTAGTPVWVGPDRDHLGFTAHVLASENPGGMSPPEAGRPPYRTRCARARRLPGTRGKEQSDENHRPDRAQSHWRDLSSWQGGTEPPRDYRYSSACAAAVSGPTVQ
jgi:hypothetical protein